MEEQAQNQLETELTDAVISESSRWSFEKGSYRRAFSVSSWSGARCTSPS